MAAAALRKTEPTPEIQSDINSWILELDGIQRYWLKLQSLRLQCIRMAAEVESLGESESAIPLWARLIGVKQRQLQSQREATQSKKEAMEVKWGA